jgi:hypothetical protein
MVRIVDYKERVNALGETFYSLILEGGMEFVKSKTTGRLYATGKRASITSTFDKQTCKGLIGQELPGSIRRIEVDPYSYADPRTGEMLMLSHRWEYTQETEGIKEALFQDEWVDNIKIIR